MRYLQGRHLAATTAARHNTLQKYTNYEESPQNFPVFLQTRLLKQQVFLLMQAGKCRVRHTEVVAALRDKFPISNSLFLTDRLVKVIQTMPTKTC